MVEYRIMSLEPSTGGDRLGARTSLPHIQRNAVYPQLHIPLKLDVPHDQEPQERQPRISSVPTRVARVELPGELEGLFRGGSEIQFVSRVRGGECGGDGGGAPFDVAGGVEELGSYVELG